MKHEVKVRFPANSDVVIKAFTDKDFHTGKLGQMGITDYTVEDHSFDGEDFRIKIRRKVPLEVPIPGALKRILGGGALTVIHEDCWNVATKTGHVNMDVQGMPIDLACDLSLADEGNDCVYTYLWDIRASVPLIGGKLEKTMIADMENKIPAETEASIPLLEKYR